MQSRLPANRQWIKAAKTSEEREEGKKVAPRLLLHEQEQNRPDKKQIMEEEVQAMPSDSCREKTDLLEWGPWGLGALGYVKLGEESSPRGMNTSAMSIAVPR